MFLKKYQLCLICISLLCSSQMSLASDSEGHHRHNHSDHTNDDSAFYGHLDVKVHADSVIDAEESDAEIEEVYTHSHFEMGFRLGKGFSVNANIKLEGEPSGHSHAHASQHHHDDGSEMHDDHDEHDEDNSEDDNRFFDDHPLYIEELTVNYDSEHISAYVGKFAPVVGFDFHDFPGIYTYQTIESYAIRERIGLGVGLKHNTEDYGTHRLDLSTFFADTSLLNNAIFYKRGGKLRKEDGGVSNTEDFSSFALSLGGHGLYPLDAHIGEGFSYRLGYAKQKAGVDGERDERRHSLSFSYEHPLFEYWTAKLITEYLDIEHLNGEQAHDRSYNTFALGLYYQRWNISTSYTDIDNDAKEEEEDHNGNIFQVSVGYRFANGIGIDLGYQRSDEEDEVSRRIGLLMGYSYDL